MLEQQGLVKKPSAAFDLDPLAASSASSAYGYDNPLAHTQLRDYWLALRKYLWLIVTLNLVLTSLVAVYMAQRPNVYRAEARVQVNLESNPALGGTEKSVVINSMSYDPAYFSTQLQILEGSGLLRRVVKTIDLEHNQAFINPLHGRQRSPWQNVLRMFGFDARPEAEPEVARAADSKLLSNTRAPFATDQESEADAEQLAPYVRLVKGGLQISPVKEKRVAYNETRLIDIEYTHHDPAIAAKVANAIADVYVMSNLEKKVESNNSAGEFLQKRVAELQSQIRSSEERLLNYSKSNAITSLNNDQNTVVQRMADLNRRLTEAQGERISAEAAYRASLAPGAAQTLSDGADGGFAQHEGKLAELRQRREQLLVEYTPEWPEVVEIDRQIAAIQQELQNSRSRASQSVVSNLEIKYRQALAREQELSRDFERQRNEVISQNEAAINYHIIEQEIATNKTLLDGLLQRSRENDVILNGTPNNVLVVDRALVPRTPVGPQRLKYVGLTFIATFFSGVGLAFLLRYLDNTIRTHEEVEATLMLPAVVSIPTFRRGGRARLFARRLFGKNKQPSMALLDPARDKPSNEAFMHLRTSVMLASAGGPPKTILVTSGQSSEGKTSVACNLAVALAQQPSAKVLIVDADMRRPCLHHIFKVPNESGLSNLLAGARMDEREMFAPIVQHKSTGVYVLPAGAVPPNPPDLLGSPQMLKLVEMLEARFTHVVIDSPPVVYFTDSTIISTFVKGVLVVVRSGKSTRHTTLRAQKMLLDVGAKIFGVVLNDVPPAASGYYYNDAYDYQPPPPSEVDAGDGSILHLS